jgi:hypothetical protein
MPLELLADAVGRYGISMAVASQLFSAYAEFVGVLDDMRSREALEKLRAADSEADSTFQRVRIVSKAFEQSLDHIFFENSTLAPLTRKYGVF